MTTVRRLLTVVAVLAVAGCSAGARVQTNRSPDASSATTAPIGTSSNAATPQRCPAPAMTHPDIANEQIGGQWNTVLDYARGQSEFTGLTITGEPGKQTMRVAFVRDVTKYQQKLDELEPGPLPVIAELSTSPDPATLRAVADEIRNEASAPPDQSIVYDQVMPAVEINLDLGQEALGDHYIERYGELVTVKLGYRVYVPTGCPGATPVPCQELTTALPTTPDVTATLSAPAKLAQPDDGRATLRVQNKSEASLAFYGSGSGLAGTVLDPVTKKAVGNFRGAFTADLHEWLFMAGSTAEVGVSFSASACGSTDVTLPPGNYLLQATVALGPLRGGNNFAPLEPTLMVTAETAFAITGLATGSTANRPPTTAAPTPPAAVEPATLPASTVPGTKPSASSTVAPARLPAGFCDLATLAAQGRVSMDGDIDSNELVTFPGLSAGDKALIRYGVATAAPKVRSGNGWDTTDFVEVVNKLCGLHLTPIIMTP